MGFHLPARPLSLRLWLPSLVLLYALVGGLFLYVAEVWLHSVRFEAVFQATQLLRTAQIQSEVERWVQHDDPERVQSVVAELGVNPELRAALYLDATGTVLAATQRALLGGPVDVTRLGLDRADQARLTALMQTVRQGKRQGAMLTNDRNVLVICLPTALPLLPGQLDLRRRGLILACYDLSLRRAASLREVRDEFGVYFATSLLIALAVGGSLHFLVVRRLKRVAAAIVELAPESRPACPKPARGDEISELSSQFGAMSDVIRRESARRTRVETELRRANRVLRTLGTCNQVLIHAASEPELLREVCRVIVEEGGYRMAWVGYAEGDANKTIRPVGHAGLAEGYLEKTSFTWADDEQGRRPCGVAIRTGRPAVCRNIPVDPDFAPWREEATKRGFASTLALPMRERERTFGVLVIYAGEANIFDETETKLLVELTEDLVFGIVALRAKEALRQAGAYNRSLIEASLDPLVAIGPDGKITDVNAASETAAGRSRAELIGASFIDYLVEPEKGREGFQRVLREGAVRDFPLELRRSDGTTFPALLNATLYRDEAGQVSGVFAAIRDVTERQRVERVLRESSEILGRVFDSTHFGVVYLDRNFNFIMVNRAYAQGCGYPPEFFPGKNHFALYPHAENEAIFREVVRSGQSATFIAKPFTFPDHPERGVTYWDWTLHPLKGASDEVEALLFVLLDVTERRRAEDDLRRLNVELEQRVADRTRELMGANQILAAEVAERKRAEARVQRQVDVTSGVNRILHETLTCETDTEVARVHLDVSLQLTGSVLGFVLESNAAGRLNVIALNQAARSVCAIPLEESMRMLGNMEPASFWGRMMKTGRSQIVNRPESDPDCRGTPAGHMPIRRFLGVPLKEGSRVVGIVGLANKETDYTEDDQHTVEALSPAFMEALKRKRAEQTVHRLHEELAARARSLEEANRELESFSYSVSHDLRAPLRSIDGFSRILLEEYTPKLDEEGQDSLRRLRGASQRMGELIDQILKLSRTARGEMRYTSVDLSAIVREIVAELGSSASGRRVEWAIAPGLTVVGDLTLLRVVLQNLLENAWKFTNRRTCAHIEFGATVTPEGERAFFVRDDGAGFDMAFADKLFSPFQRMHTVKEFPGTGIGLATVKRIIHRHGGRVWAEAGADAGATFYFTLPPQPHRP